LHASLPEIATLAEAAQMNLRWLLTRSLPLLIFLVGCSAAVPGESTRPAMAPGPTGIAGRVFDRFGQPVAGAYVYAYRSTRTQLRGPADFAAPVDAAGNYFLDLVEGDYYLVARQRKGRADSGPPQTGDAWAVHVDNPVQVLPGHTSRADFRIQSISRPMSLGKGGVVNSETRLTGQVVDRQGVPVVGAIVMAYQDEDLKRMPDFVSPASDEAGRFVLPVAGGGRYCLAARTKTRGQPQPGELYGLYRGVDDTPCLNVSPDTNLEIGQIRLEPYRQ